MEKNRQFLTFKTEPFVQNLNDKIQVFTDHSGGFEFLAEISLRDFARISQSHFQIVDNVNYSIDRKLRSLVQIWQKINSRISGYLFGDLPENNP